MTQKKDYARYVSSLILALCTRTPSRSKNQVEEIEIIFEAWIAGVEGPGSGIKPPSLAYFGMIRTLAMLAAVPSEVWMDAAPPAERLELHQRCLRRYMESGEKAISLADATPCRGFVPDQTSSEVLENASSVMWDLTDALLDQGRSPADVIIAMYHLLIVAAHRREDPRGACAWMLEEHRRQFVHVSSPEFVWPDLSGFRSADVPKPVL